MQLQASTHGEYVNMHVKTGVHSMQGQKASCNAMSATSRTRASQTSFFMCRCYCTRQDQAAWCAGTRVRVMMSQVVDLC